MASDSFSSGAKDDEQDLLGASGRNLMQVLLDRTANEYGILPYDS